MKKKLLNIIVILLFAIILVSCNQETTNSSASTEPLTDAQTTIEAVTTTTALTTQAVTTQALTTQAVTTLVETTSEAATTVTETSTSNNADAASISLDAIALDGFLPSVQDYTVYLPTSVIPTVTAIAADTNSTVIVTQAADVTEITTVVITAEDTTTKTYTISYVVAGLTDLKSIKLDDVLLVGFNSARTDYYILLEDTVMPVITYSTYYDETTVVMSSVIAAPQTVTLTVTNGAEETVYTIEFAVRDALAYNIPNFGFEATFDWQTWSGTAATPGLSTEEVHSGLYALKSISQSSVWKELEFVAGLPTIGDAIKLGLWVYIDSDAPTYDFTLKAVGFTISTSAEEVFAEVQIIDGIALNQWVYIEGNFGDILESDRIKFIIENNSGAIIYVDDLQVIDGVSSNALLDEIQLDSIALAGFDALIEDYVYITDGINIPVVTATALNPNATVLVTGALAVDGFTTILVTAEDGTEKTYTIDLRGASTGLLAGILINGVTLEDFVATRNTYYIYLPGISEASPTVTALAIDNSDTITITKGVLPGYTTILVETTGGVSNEYVVYFEEGNNASLSTPYPDVNFDKNLEGWGFSSAVDVTQTSEKYLNGSQSLKMVGGVAWLDVNLTGGDYPSNGNAYSIGMWIYVEGSATTGFTITLLEKENNIELINETVTVLENNRWIYVQTEISGDVSAVASYLRIVINNGTGETVYVDAIRLIEQASLVIE
ncbi:MAG: hypothetical protein JEZ05_09865 [Tenericutes bacterium]|nr:hypothetical protein [Mycoplasmatota bacterium]